jgi:hypothetical protein
MRRSSYRLGLLRPGLFGPQQSALSPPAWAIARRSGTSSMAMMRPAPIISAERMANWPTGPQPQMATVSPGWICAFSAAM